LSGVGLTVITGDQRFDAVGSIGIGLLLGVVATVLAVEMRSLLIGESASEQDLAIIRDAVEQEPCYERLIELRTMHLGPTDPLIAMRVELDNSLTFDDVADRLDQIEDRIRARLPATGQVFIEADTGRRHRRRTARRRAER
jgi:divalent metal cation (Fe/Co/Zn/Cd) transporter